MPEFNTTIRLMTTDFPVTVTWDVCGVDDGAPEYEIESVVSELLGDVTDVVLNSKQGHTFVDWANDFTWQDPVRTAMFGRDFLYHPDDFRVLAHAQPYMGYAAYGLGRPSIVVQREPARVVVRTFSALQQKIFDEIDELPELGDRVAAYLDSLHNDDY